MKPLVIGHRGAAAYALENTASSFQKAVELGVDWIEFDVHESQDGEFIIIHDRHLGRISDFRNLVHRSDTSTLKAIPLYQGEKLLTLMEALETIPRSIGLMVEIKSLRNVTKIVSFLEAQASRRKLMLTSFDLSLLFRIQTYTKKLLLGVVSKSAGNITKARKMGIVFFNVCLDFQGLTASLVSKYHQQNFKVFAWTVDRSGDIRRLLEMKVDGIISNKPDLVKAILSKTGAEIDL